MDARRRTRGKCGLLASGQRLGCDGCGRRNSRNGSGSEHEQRRHLAQFRCIEIHGRAHGLRGPGRRLSRLPQHRLRRTSGSRGCRADEHLHPGRLFHGRHCERLHGRDCADLPAERRRRLYAGPSGRTCHQRSWYDKAKRSPRRALARLRRGRARHPRPHDAGRRGHVRRQSAGFHRRLQGRRTLSAPQPGAPARWRHGKDHL